MRKVLLADDEKELAEACEASLALAGYEVTVAYDGAEAVRILTARPFDLVITDLRMPRLDGFTVLRWIMSHKPDTKVIVMTAFGTPTVTDTVKRLGALHCLSKPVDRDRLLETVESALGASGFSAVIQNITAADYVQLCMYTGKTTLFEVFSGNKKGTIAIVGGNVTYVEQGELKGEPAFFEIISWEGGQITEKKLSAPLTPNVRTGGQSLVLEALRLKDEARRAQQLEAAHSSMEGPPLAKTAATVEYPAAPSPSHGTDRAPQGERDPVAPGASELDELSERLKRDARVAEYGIFVEQDFLRYKRSVTGATLYAAPSLCLKLGDLLKEELRCGPLRYVLINIRGGARYMVFRFLNARGVVGLRPDVLPEDFWETLRPRELT